VQEINSSGLVTGYFIDGDEIHGFFDQDGVVTPYDVPGANLTIISTPGRPDAEALFYDFKLCR
jgi:hypothetical protein